MSGYTYASEIHNHRDLIDSREVIDRIEELRQEWADATSDDPDDYALSGDDWLVGLSEDERDELEALQALASEAENYAADWRYGATLIHNDYFETYAQQLAEDLGLIDSEASWPSYCIDWERAASDLQMDYTSIDFGGETYWVHS